MMSIFFRTNEFSPMAKHDGTYIVHTSTVKKPVQQTNESD